ncbi:response regulator transcription factor [Trinickia violacea]|uniref:Response regulator transcription factor n=1 Tax=Trinickia violacea TaxID=2571746 RepID=A0A4P8IKT6_9BURK|nr:response regulator transcription factor [Trinickia violacea]QCP48165.1 response regulator transcription factor [Trinickia violacea]
MTIPIRIIVADDHPSVCLGMTRLLSSAPGFAVVGQASDAQSLAACLDACPCDVIVSDIGMPGLNGESNAIPLLRKVLRQGPRPYVIVITMINHGQMLTDLLQMGVSAIVDKRDAADSLTLAIESIGTGQPYLSRHVIETIGAIDGFPASRAGFLSCREWEVFQLYAKGMAIHQIAERLGRSGKTISTQKRSTMRKLGLDTEAQLIEYARQIGLT